MQAVIGLDLKVNIFQSVLDRLKLRNASSINKQINWFVL